MNGKKYKFRTFEGITLISLIITIVVLIILAGIGINLSLGSNGIFNKAKEAKEETNKQTATEKINLKITNAQMNKYAEKQEMPTLKELSEVLRDDKEIAYVTEKSQIASTKYEVGENPISIFTKLNEYPYEFEINGSLQLASIDGVEISKDNYSTVKSAITAKATESYAITSGKIKVNFNTVMSSTGNNLSIVDGGIKIGKNINNILVSASSVVTSKSSGVMGGLSIHLNETEVFKAYNRTPMASSDGVQTAMHLVNVKEGDIIYAYNLTGTRRNRISR